MIHPHPDDKPLDPAQARLVAKMRRLMLLSGFATLLGVAVVIAVIGYRVFRAQGSAAPADMVAMVPKGARVVATAVAGDRVIVTLDIGGTTEVLSFHAATLQPAGRLRFVSEP
jgi:hypothetical protein